MPLVGTSEERCPPRDSRWTTRSISIGSSSGGRFRRKLEGGGSQGCRHPRSRLGRLAHSVTCGVVVLGCARRMHAAVPLHVVVLGCARRMHAAVPLHVVVLGCARRMHAAMALHVVVLGCARRMHAAMALHVVVLGTLLVVAHDCSPSPRHRPARKYGGGPPSGCPSFARRARCQVSDTPLTDRRTA